MLKSRFFLFLLLSIPATCFAGDVLAKNTRLEVRLDQNLGSDISAPGQNFTATLIRSVKLGGKDVLQKGAVVEGIVKDAESTLNYSRAGELALQLTSVTSGGREIRLTTSILTFQGRARPINPTTGKQDDRGARVEDATRAAGGVLGGANTNTTHTIPGTSISVGPSTPSTGMQVILPAKSKLVFTVTSAD
ncbi:MAG: hypothetical protein HY010_13850 [Acidobacteria bacterium]|nr:hypothetical protein [Acidobacteriota bacterium]